MKMLLAEELCTSRRRVGVSWAFSWWLDLLVIGWVNIFGEKERKKNIVNSCTCGLYVSVIHKRLKAGARELQHLKEAQDRRRWDHRRHAQRVKFACLITKLHIQWDFPRTHSSRKSDKSRKLLDMKMWKWVKLENQTVDKPHLNQIQWKSVKILFSLIKFFSLLWYYKYPQSASTHIMEMKFTLILSVIILKSFALSQSPANEQPKVKSEDVTISNYGNLTSIRELLELFSIEYIGNEWMSIHKTLSHQCSRDTTKYLNGLSQRSAWAIKSKLEVVALREEFLVCYNRPMCTPIMSARMIFMMLMRGEKKIKVKKKIQVLRGEKTRPRTEWFVNIWARNFTFMI